MVMLDWQLASEAADARTRSVLDSILRDAIYDLETGLDSGKPLNFNVSNLAPRTSRQPCILPLNRDIQAR
jgi:hypothetical protein